MEGLVVVEFVTQILRSYLMEIYFIDIQTFDK